MGFGKKSQPDEGVSLPPSDAGTADTQPAAEPAPVAKPFSLDERVARIERYLRAQGFDV